MVTYRFSSRLDRGPVTIQPQLMTAVFCLVQTIEHRERAGNRVNPGGEGGKFLESRVGGCLQKTPTQGVVSPRRMA